VDARVAELEAKNAELRNDVNQIAIFAKTLLGLLEERGVVTEAQFQEALKKLQTDAPAVRASGAGESRRASS
jgi:hypothetical protein